MGMKTMQGTKRSRHGVHKDGDVRVQFWTALRKRRLLQYLAVISEKTFDDIVWEGLVSVANRYGLIDMRTGDVRLDKWSEIEAVAKRMEELKKAIRRGKS